MKQKTNKMLIFTSLAAYFTYFIHGIGASILGQYKPEFAAAWGAKPLADGTLDVSMVVSVIAALGLGRLISLPFSGPLSDKYGRKLSGIIGVLCYVAYFFGMANSTSMAMGYAFAVIGGIANSFLDTCVSPTCMEIYVNNPSVANLFTKFSICLSQFLLPFLIGIVASANMSYKTIFIVAGIAILIDGILILILYPLISTIMLLLCYFIQAPFICLIGGFVIGYAGAGGVLQLAVSTTAEFFPENKGTATSLVMIASSIANYTILSLAGYITKVGGSSAPRMILLLNMAVTIVGILLALFVKKNRNK